MQKISARLVFRKFIFVLLLVWIKCTFIKRNVRYVYCLICMQLHIVHWNTDLCPSVSEALKSANGLAVLCVFFQVTLVCYYVIIIV